jgi:hypothetical protein
LKIYCLQIVALHEILSDVFSPIKCEKQQLAPEIKNQRKGVQGLRKNEIWKYITCQVLLYIKYSQVSFKFKNVISKFLYIFGYKLYVLWVGGPNS